MLDDLQQGVIQDGQNQPPVATAPAQGTDKNIAPDDSLQGVKDAEIDERGVPYKNVAMEAQRKLDKAQEEIDYWKNFASQQQQVMSNFQQNAQQPQQAHARVEPELTEEQLIAIEQTSPEDAAKVRAYREDRLMKRIMRGVESQILPKVTAVTEQKTWDAQAYKDFPELNTQGKFRDEVVSLLNRKVVVGPEAVYRAAQIAATKFPNMQKPRNQAIPQTRDDVLAQHSVATSAPTTSKSAEQLPDLSMRGKDLTAAFGADQKEIQKLIQGYKQQVGGK
jgi:hypothetical protein